MAGKRKFSLEKAYGWILLLLKIFLVILLISFLCFLASLYYFQKISNEILINKEVFLYSPSAIILSLVLIKISKLNKKMIKKYPRCFLIIFGIILLILCMVVILSIAHIKAAIEIFLSMIKYVEIITH